MSRLQPVRRRAVGLGALGLVVNAIVLWNTRYMDAVLSKLQADGDAIADADVRRLSPLVHKHLNFLGRYHFSLPGDVSGGVLRELRDPNAGLEEEWAAPGRQPLAYISVPLLLRPHVASLIFVELTLFLSFLISLRPLPRSSNTLESMQTGAYATDRDTTHAKR